MQCIGITDMLYELKFILKACDETSDTYLFTGNSEK